MAVAFNEHAFRARFDRAYAEVRTVLDTERQPVLAADVPHVYEDKYELTSSMLNCSITAAFEGKRRITLRRHGHRIAPWHIHLVMLATYHCPAEFH